MGIGSFLLLSISHKLNLFSTGRPVVYATHTQVPRSSQAHVLDQHLLGNGLKSSWKPGPF